MTNHDIAQWVEPCVELAKRAGLGILDVYTGAGGFDIITKSDNSPLTKADLISNDIITTGLKSLTPDIPIITEENTIPPFNERRDWSVYWLIDPLDGTREFINRSGEFTVNIALIENNRPVVGVIYIPVSGVSYYACAGKGTLKRDNRGDVQPIKTRVWEASDTKVLASHSRRLEDLRQRLADIATFDIKHIGSSLKFCRIAEGIADFYPRLGPTSEWDTGAGQCILEEAGGKVVDLQGRPLVYNSSESILNPHFMALGDTALLDVILKHFK